MRHDFKMVDVSPMTAAAAYNKLCIGLTGKGNFDEAIASCINALDLEPSQFSFYNNRANIYFFLGQYDKALAEYYKAMTFSHGDNDADDQHRHHAQA